MAINLTPITKAFSTSTNSADKVFNNKVERDIDEIDPAVKAAAKEAELARLRALKTPLVTPKTSEEAPLVEPTIEPTVQEIPEVQEVPNVGTLPVAQPDENPFEALGIKDPGDSPRAQKQALDRIQVLDKDGRGVTITDAQRIRAIERLKLTNMSKMEAGLEQNVYVFDNQFNKAYSDIADDNWIANERDEWFNTNKPYLSKQFIEDWESGSKTSNEADGEQMIARYEREHALTEHIFKDGFWEGMGVNVATGLASPQDAPLYFLPFLKAGKTMFKFVEDVNKWKQVAKGGLVGSGIASYSEGTRQTLAGIDLNDEYAVAAIGFFFGGSVEGIRAGWNKMTVKQKADFNAHVEEYANLLRENSKVPVTDTPTGTPKNTANWFFNPSPMERLYASGLASIYRIASKLKPSTLNLLDKNGHRVVQKEVNAFELNALYEGRGTIAQAKLQEIQNQAKKAGISPEDFDVNVDKAFKETTLANRNRDAEKGILRSQIEVLDKAIAKLEKPKKAVTPKTALLHKKKIQLLNDQKKVLESSIEAVDLAFKPHVIEDPLTKQAVDEIQAFYKLYNDDIWRLDKLDIDDAFTATIAKLTKKLDGLTDEKAIAKLESKIDKVEAQYKVDTSELDKTMASRQDSYGPRYWSAAFIGEDIEASTAAIIKGLLNGPHAKALKKYDPEGYEKYAKDIPAIAEKMVVKISTAEDVGALRDIAGLPLQGSGSSKFGAKSNRQRKVDVDELELGDLVNTNWNSTMMAYSYDMGRKLSTREALGVKNPKEFLEKYLLGLQTEITKSNLSALQKKNALADVKDMVDEALGIRGRSSDPQAIAQQFKRTLMNVNNAYFGLGFAPAQMGEAGPAIKASGAEFFKQLSPGFKKAWGEYRRKGFDEDDIDALNGINIGGMIQKQEAAARFEDGNTQAYNRGEAVTTGQKIDSGLHWAASKSMTFGGMPLILTGSKYATAGAYMVRVHRIANKMSNEGYVLSRSEANYFSRNGLTPEDFLKISKQPLYDDAGNQNYNLSGWTDEAAESMNRSTMRATDEAILNPSGYDLPKFMTKVNDIAGPMLTQYLRFPVASYNQLLKNGMSDKDARSLVAVLVSYAGYGMTIYLQEQLLVATGAIDQSDAKYDIATEEGRANVAVKATSYNPALSSLGKPMEIISAITGMNYPGTDYASDPKDVLLGAGGTTAFKGIDALQGILQDGEFNRSARFLALPGDRHPILGGPIQKVKEFVSDTYLDPIASSISDAVGN